MQNLFLKWMLVLAVWVSWCSKATAQNKEKRPNIIFILTDDQPYDYLGCTGNTIVKTPNIDRLAKEGILFTNAYVATAICTPSRVSIFLSQYERKHGVNFNSGTSVSEEAWKDSYPMALRAAGYYTGYVGKNHAPIGEGGFNSGVIQKSFDYWYGAMGHLGFYPKKRDKIFKDAKHDTQVEVLEEGALDFLDDNEYKLKNALHFLDQRPDDKPFCLSICFNLPHGAGTGSMLQLPTDSVIYRDLYRDINIPPPANYIAKDDIKKQKLPHTIFHPEDRQKSYDYVDNRADLKERMIREYEAMTGIDGLVGNLRTKLRNLKIDENTILIFTSDHGLFHGEFGLGGKALCYQQTTHVPLIIYNPKQKPANHLNDQLVQTIDIAPTMLSYANVNIPASYQGKDLSPLAGGSKQAVRDFLFTENLWSTPFGNPRCEAVQDKEWKYIRYYQNDNLSANQKVKVGKQMGLAENKVLYGITDDDLIQYRIYSDGPLTGEQPVYEELYHLKTDPTETTNLVNESKYKVMLGKLQSAWKTAIIAARGTGNPKVVRFTKESEGENNRVYKPE